VICFTLAEIVISDRHYESASPLAAPKPDEKSVDLTHDNQPLAHPCQCCGGRMIIIETVARGATPRDRPTSPTTLFRIDTS
jgi:hypothetical protein